MPDSSSRSATSYVEAGVDFSFRTAFRESWGLVNLLQIAGRANRSRPAARERKERKDSFGSSPRPSPRSRRRGSLLCGLCVLLRLKKTVLVDQSLIKRIESRDRTQFPSWRDIMQNSVQIWASRLDPGKLPVKPVGPDGELWAWIGAYDNFLGYLAGVLPLLKAGEKGL